MKRTYFPNDMIWRLESSWVYLTLFIKDSCTCCCYRLSIVVDLWYDLIYTVFYFELADDIYSVPVFCTDPYLYVSFFVICGVQQTYRRLQLNRNSSQSSLHRISGWANASNLDWIFFFMSWCLEVPAWTSFLFILSFLDTFRVSNLRIDVLVMMTSRFWG